MTIYDNSNIAESYAGVTTPLTFSFVVHAYQGVYTNFCRMMGVDPATIRTHSSLFEHMVEFIGCTLYYNLTNWYVMLSLFPGYQFSSRFMEKMMGVKKEYHARTTTTSSALKRYFVHLPCTVLHSGKIIVQFILVGIRIKRFNRTFDRILSSINRIDLQQLSLDDLKNLYTRLDRDLLARWSVPIANDFAVMVSTGLAERLFQQWLHSDNAYAHMRAGSLQPIASLDPGNRLTIIAQEIDDDRELSILFSSDMSDDHIFEQLRGPYQKSPASCHIEQYLREYGMRIPNELKLESETLNEHPALLVRRIRMIVQNTAPISPRGTIDRHPGDLDSLSLPKKIFLRLILRWASVSISRREETRLKRTQVFGFARRLFLAVGEKMRQHGLLDHSRDVLYLTVEEVLETRSNLCERVAQRKRKQKLWEKIPLPRRIETDKCREDIENELLAQRTEGKEPYSNNDLYGRVASRPEPTTAISGEALTLPSFDPCANYHDKILITRHTDPGWIMVFPTLKALVVERGGMLSHAAVAARELNIPCIIGVDRATDCIATGTTVTLDLSTGAIHLASL